MEPLDLFSSIDDADEKRYMPLAARMRPEKLDDLAGQEDLVGPGRPLRRAIESDRLTSLMLFGPPGSGKTTIAHVIAKHTKAHFEQLSAVTSGVADIKRVIAEARDRKRVYRARTVLFIDEIHRFNKSQQDALLPAVEDGTIVLIGATTANPFFDINAALLSRSQLVRLQPLTSEALATIVARALTDEKDGFGTWNVELSDEAMQHLLRCAAGDARTALNGLERAVLNTPASEDGILRIGLNDMEEAVLQKTLRYDKNGDQHYDIISAFIKSMRGSDPDAAVYWMSRMLAAGEDPRFILRRIVICASEDVGNADPMALVVATSAVSAYEMIGLPEAKLNMAQAAIYVASAPKSNAVIAALGRAESAVEANAGQGLVPIHLRDSAYASAKKLGHGVDYRYAHDYPENFVEQQYLPDELLHESYYRPTANGSERALRQRLARLWKGLGRYPSDNMDDETKG